MKSKIIVVLIAIFVLSCNKKSNINPKVSIKDTLFQGASEDEEEMDEQVDLRDLKFPETGKKN